MKVLLIYPAWPGKYWPRGGFRSYWIPTGLAHIAGILEKDGHELRVHVCEEHIIKNNHDRTAADRILHRELESFRPDVVGFSVLTPGMSEMIRIARLAKSICGERTLLIAGGVHPTALPERTLRECPDLDAVVVGEGEWTMRELLIKGIADTVAGLVYRENGAFIHTGRRQPECNPDRLGMPAYHLFDMEFYTRPNRWMIPWLNLSVTNIRTSRGCPGHCAFCAGTLVSGPGVRFHSVEHVMTQIEKVVSDFGVEAIHFEDDSFGTDRERVFRICDALRQSGLSRRIRWDCGMRVDQVDSELLAEMKSAGCIEVEYGFETGSDRALAAIGKQSTRELNLRAVELTRQADLRIFADIMVGLPGETSKDWRATRKFIRQTKPDVLIAALLCPLPGTPIFKHLPQEKQDAVQWDAFTYLEPLKLDLCVSPLPKRKVKRLYHLFNDHMVVPHTVRAMLHDSRPEEHALRKKLRRWLLRFRIHHPIQALRLPRRYRSSPEK